MKNNYALNKYQKDNEKYKEINKKNKRNKYLLYIKIFTIKNDFIYIKRM